METTSKSKTEQKLWLKMKMGVLNYVVINTFLVVVNWVTSPHYWWVLWVISGWGIGLILKLISRYTEYKIDRE